MTTIRHDGDLKDLRFPLGLDNTSAEHRVPAGAARELRDIDVRSDGSWRSRGGYTKVLAFTDAHSGFAADDWPYLMVRDGADLLAIDPALEPVVIASGLGDELASYTVLNGELLWTVEGRATGRIDSLLVNRELGLPTPSPPALTAALFGGLSAGSYRVARSYLDNLGQESGLSEPTTIVVTQGAAIEVAWPPVPAGVAKVRVYRSEPDGSELFHALDTTAGAATLGNGGLGDSAETMGMDPLPAGHLIAELNGVVWMALDRWLLHSVPMRPFLAEADNHLGLDARIDLLLPVGQAENAGLFVAAGKRTYYFAGGTPGAMKQDMKRAHGAVPGTAKLVDGEAFGASGLVAVWMGSDGTPCLGLPGGAIRPLGKRAAMTARMERGAMLLRQAVGLKQLLVTGTGGHVAALATGDSAEVYQYRDGKLLT